MPEFCINSILLKQLCMRTGFSHPSIFQHQDLVAVVDGPQPVRHKHTRAGLLLDDAVNILQEGLLRVCVEC